MPEMSGLEVAQTLARISPGLPVLISSGFITQQLRDEARIAGVRGVLEKQNTVEELGGLVARILLEREQGAANGPHHPAGTSRLARDEG
jgi:DNA-binding NarL/FixJ family response regulator